MSAADPPRLTYQTSVPLGVIVLAMLSVAMPAGFPYQSEKSDGMFRSFRIAAVQKVDFLGVFLLLAASILFVTAVQEGGTEYQWKSAVVLSLFCISIVLWILFFC